MTDNVAVLDGFTDEYMAYSEAGDLFILVRPGTDLDSTFKAWDSDAQEFVRINGWLWRFERVRQADEYGPVELDPEAPGTDDEEDPNDAGRKVLNDSLAADFPGCRWR